MNFRLVASRSLPASRASFALEPGHARIGALGALLLLGLAACGPSSGNCADDEAKCDNGCTAVQADPFNCGGCGIVCGPGEGCMAGVCSLGVENCTPGVMESCYSGPSNTLNVGPCQGGMRTCSAQGVWSACVGEVIPQPEDCTNGIDEDCTGMADDAVDQDGDGYTNCAGDCCDGPADGCVSPQLVNPGAFEVAGNSLDDDCDGTADNAVADCDMGLVSNSTDAVDYARAMDLCQTATDTDGRWGVISAEFTRANGSGAPAAQQKAIRPQFGPGTLPQAGMGFALLSTGRAAAQGDTSPAFAAFQGGQDMGTTSAVPGDWLAANGNNFPNAPGCPEPQGGTTANDPIMLKLRVRVPTNAQSFSFSSRFYSSEYPEWVCSPYNDFFVALLDSTFAGMPANPVDKNLARYTAPSMAEYPVGVNLAFGNTGLFTECLNGQTGCGGGSVAGNSSTCTGVAGLQGTGFDIANPPAQFGNDPGYCGASNLAGGATAWLSTSGNVVPGEIIELRIAVWDTGDPWYDSLVLLDNFQWSIEASDPGTVID